MCATGKNKSRDKVVGFGPKFVASRRKQREKNDPIKSNLQKKKKVVFCTISVGYICIFFPQPGLTEFRVMTTDP